MTYLLDILPELDRKLGKLAKKDKLAYERALEKMDEILDEPHRYKPLGNVMSGNRRVHVGSFVLIFSINEATKTVVFRDFDHHDKIYGR